VFRAHARHLALPARSPLWSRKKGEKVSLVISFASVDGLEEEEEGHRAIGYGLHVQGVPVGENACVLHELDRLTDKRLWKKSR
jgi:hypothetical protein